MSASERQSRLVGDEGELFALHSERLWHGVRAQIAGPDALVDDACQQAWVQLMRRGEAVERTTALAWLRTTAVRAAWVLAERDRREASLDAPVPLKPGQVREGATVGEVLADQRPGVDEVAEQRETLRLVDEIAPRQRDVVLMLASGLNYQEIAQRTGDTPRTVERQLMRGKRALRELRRDVERAPGERAEPGARPRRAFRERESDLGRDVEA